jgi:hypothetical protein
VPPPPFFAGERAHHHGKCISRKAVRRPGASSLVKDSVLLLAGLLDLEEFDDWVASPVVALRR